MFEYDESLLSMASYRWGSGLPFHPLQFEQTAAPLFITVSQAITTIWRTDEYGYRLLPLITSLLLLPVMYYAVSRLWSRCAAIVAVLLACHHLGLLRYSAIFKQYEIDAFVTAAILAFGGYYRRNAISSTKWLLLLVGGIIAILISQTAVISLFALLLFIVAQTHLFSFPSEQGGDPDRERVNTLHWIVACTALWGTVALTIYFLLYAPVARSAYMRAFWTDSYLNVFGGDVVHRWRNAGESLFGSLPGQMVAGFPLLLLGVYGIGRKKDIPLLLLVTGPCVATIALGVLHRYPVALRLWLFLSPAVIVAISIGASILWDVAIRTPPGIRLQSPLPPSLASY
jgi:hypothetical protein